MKKEIIATFKNFNRKVFFVVLFISIYYYNINNKSNILSVVNPKFKIESPYSYDVFYHLKKVLQVNFAYAI